MHFRRSPLMRAKHLDPAPWALRVLRYLRQELFLEAPHRLWRMVFRAVVVEYAHGEKVHRLLREHGWCVATRQPVHRDIVVLALLFCADEAAVLLQRGESRRPAAEKRVANQVVGL